MKCKYCNSEVEDGSKFCDVCGGDVSSQKSVDEKEYCPNCGGLVSKDDEFCPCIGNSIFTTLIQKTQIKIDFNI